MNIEKAFNLTLELEGLLSLLQTRGDMAPAQIRQMLQDKLALLNIELNADAPEVPAVVLDESIESEMPQAPEQPEQSVSPQDSAQVDVFAAADVAIDEPEVNVDEPQAVAEPQVATEPQVAEKAAPVREPITKFIAVNDKFLFRRELFANNGKLYDETLALIAGMNTPEDVMDYMTNDLCVDAENPTLESFMTVVKRYMSN